MTPQEIELARQRAALLGGGQAGPVQAAAKQVPRLMVENPVRAALSNANISNSFDPGVRAPAAAPAPAAPAGDSLRAALGNQNVSNSFNPGSRPMPESLTRAPAPAAAPAAPQASATGKWFGTADDWAGMGRGAARSATNSGPRITPPNPGVVAKAGGVLGGVAGAVNAVQGVREGDYLKAGVGAADAAAGAAMFTPAAPAAATYLGLRGAWEGGKAIGGVISNAIGEKGRDAIGGTINQFMQRTGLGGVDDSALLAQQNQPARQPAARAPQAAPQPAQKYTFDQVLGMLPEQNKAQMLAQMLSDPAKSLNLTATGPDGQPISVPLDRAAAMKAYLALTQQQQAAPQAPVPRGPISAAAPVAAPVVAQAQPMSPEQYAAATTPTQGVVTAFGGGQPVQRVATQELPAFDGGPAGNVVILRGNKEFMATPRADGSGFDESRLGLPKLPANATPEQRAEYVAQMQEIGGAANAQVVGKQVAQDSANAASMANAQTAAGASMYGSDQQLAGVQAQINAAPLQFSDERVIVTDAQGQPQFDQSGKVMTQQRTRIFNRVTGEEVTPKKQASGKYPEGTKLKGKDGKVYVVRNGEAVLAEGQ